MSFGRRLTGFGLLALAGGLAAGAVAAPTAGPQPVATDCERYLALARTCQPREQELTGRIFCPSFWCEAPGSRGARCKVRLDVHTDYIDPPIHTVETWWSLWSDAEQRRYYIYDGRYNIAPSCCNFWEFTYCDLSCGLRLEGLVWRDIHVWSSDRERVDAEIVEASCVDCREPTPTLSPRSLTPPAPRGCQWRAWLPLTMGGRP